ncbi:hypothetical protein [Wolbachia endosymbiont (group A) of Cheilosia soror]|uniref:hypothetical protein n=1 Tax=Wolbachia endosymbiont (group A) of Cheilosia soror TaxID=2953995 RepID=UPI0021F85A8A|nr:hypothetical protein [Wolbachia endosymbiont (group A) of Cheilosia soror]
MLASLTLGVRSLFTSSEPSTTYVKDLRKVMTYKDGRKCKYPENYDQIKKSGKIIEGENSKGETIYKLLYGEEDKDGRQPSFDLAPVESTGSKEKSVKFHYFTINFLVDPDKDAREFRSSNRSYYSKYYKPFGFSKIDLEKHIPIFEVDTQSLELTHSRVLAKKGSSLNNKGEVDEKDIDEKGRNGKLLYTSDYKKLSTHFSEIRDQNGNLELDKSLISVPIVFATSLAKVCTKLLTSLPIKLGEYLISEQNPIAKSFGYLLFTPAMAVKNLVDMGATILKAPILLFVADKKKYGDAYFTMWKHQLKGCWEEAKSDFNVIKGGERLKPGQKDHKPLSIVGTWDELNARRPDIEKELEEGLNKSSESIDKSRKPGVGKSLNNESIAESRKKAIAQEKLSNHADKITQERQAGASALSHPPH